MRPAEDGHGQGARLRPTRRRGRRRPGCPGRRTAPRRSPAMPSSKSVEAALRLDHEQAPRRERERPDRPEDDETDVERRPAHVGARIDPGGRSSRPAGDSSRRAGSPGAERAGGGAAVPAVVAVARTVRCDRVRRRGDGRRLGRPGRSGGARVRPADRVRPAMPASARAVHGGSARLPWCDGSAASSSVTSPRPAASRPPPRARRAGSPRRSRPTAGRRPARRRGSRSGPPGPPPAPPHPPARGPA